MKLEKTTKLRDGRLLHAWWANNKGRGDSNCTLVVTPAGVEREKTSKVMSEKYPSCKTSSWGGDVNVSKRVCEIIGIDQSLVD